MKSFSATEAIKFGWEVSKKRWHLFLTLGGLNVLLNFILDIPDLIFGKGSAESDTLFLIIVIPYIIVCLIVSLGMVKIPIMLADGKDAKFSDVWVTNWKLMLKFLGAGLLSGLIVLCGFILLIIPGIIFAMKLVFVPYFVVDKGLGPIQAIKASWNATKGNLLELGLLAVLSVLVVIAGVLAVLVGLIWAVPTTMVAQAYAYRKLSSRVSGVPLQG